jgi:hypothetical protein
MRLNAQLPRKISLEPSSRGGYVVRNRVKANEAWSYKAITVPNSKLDVLISELMSASQ